MDIIENLDLLSVAVTVAGTFILGFTVFFTEKKSLTNKTFLFFSIVTGLWGLANFFGYRFTNPDVAFLLLRSVMFLAVLQAFFIFKLFYVFPERQVVFPKVYKYFLLPLVLITGVLSLSPLVLSHVETVSETGAILKIINGPAIPLFGVVSVGLVLAALYVFIRNLRHAALDQRGAYIKILIGTAIMFSLIITFNFIFPAVFNNSKYLSFGALFTFPFILLTAYAIYRHKLFNIKVASVGLIAFVLTIFSFFNILYAQSTSQIVLNSTFFLVILLGSITLIRTILREVEQKEYLQVLNTELRDLLKQRESLVHLITHKVKGSFTRSKYIFAEMVAGSFGELHDMLLSMAKKGLSSDNEGIQTVDLVLNSFNLSSGTVKYDMKRISFKDIVLQVISEKKSRAEDKGLKVETEMVPEDTYAVYGDAFWLKEIVNNFVENSIRYSLQGTIHVKLERKEGKVILSVKDNGVGLTDEDKKNLFTEGGRGKDSIRLNIDSTGYGLFSVRLIAEAHKGRVWAESEGKDKGSTFYVELHTEPQE